MRRRSTASRYGICSSAAVAARSAGCWNARGEICSSRYAGAGTLTVRSLDDLLEPLARRTHAPDLRARSAVDLHDVGREVVGAAQQRRADAVRGHLRAE